MQWRHNGGHIPDEVWQLFWDGELSAAEAAHVKAHAEVCPACRAAGAEWRRLLASISDLPDELLTPGELAAVQRHVGARIRRQRRWHGLLSLLAALAFVPVLLEAVAWSASVWQWLAGQLGGGGTGLELSTLLVRGAVRLLIWADSLPPAVSLGLLLAVGVANMLLLRIGLSVWERHTTGGIQV